MDEKRQELILKRCVQSVDQYSLYKDLFVELTHRGSDLKKRKHARPNPKRPNSVPYRDIKRQNDWITENLFDPMGNYLFDNSCIREALGISKAETYSFKESQKSPIKRTTERHDEGRC